MSNFAQDKCLLSEWRDWIGSFTTAMKQRFNNLDENPVIFSHH